MRGVGNGAPRPDSLRSTGVSPGRHASNVTYVPRRGAMGG